MSLIDIFHHLICFGLNSISCVNLRFNNIRRIRRCFFFTALAGEVPKTSLSISMSKMFFRFLSEFVVVAIKISLSLPPVQHKAHSDVKCHHASPMKNIGRHIKLYCTLRPGSKGERKILPCTLYSIWTLLCNRLQTHSSKGQNTFTNSTLRSKSET